jgi:integral membrane protein
MSKRHDHNAQLLRFTHRIGIWEGVSYLILLFIAMPLKYGMNMPEAVRWTGAAHGFLFVGFMGMLYYGFMSGLFSLKTAIRAFLLSLIPLGTFYLSFDKSVN